MAVEIKLPVSRIVWGHPMRAQIKKDQQTKAVIMKDGKPVEQRVMGLAIPRQQFDHEVWPQLLQEIRTGYPGAPQQMPQPFSAKYKDGDGNDRTGKPYNTREGYAGHYVLTVSSETGFPPPCWRYDMQSRQYVQLAENEIKTGDFVQVTIDAKLNVPQNKTHTPGLYINPKGILFVAYGNEIMNQGGDPTELFGAAPPQFQLPPGASMQPMAPQTGASMPGMGAPPQQPGGYPGAPGPQQGYTPPPGPVSSGPAPQQQYGQPQQYGAPQQPQQPGAYPGAPQPGPQGYAPAPDFVHNAGHQPPQQGYTPPPMGQPPQQQQYGQPQPGAYPGAPQQPGPGQQYPGGYQPPR